MSHSRLREDISIESGLRARTLPVIQNAIARDPGVDDSHSDVLRPGAIARRRDAVRLRYARGDGRKPGDTLHS
jgi:hypothetical protein